MSLSSVPNTLDDATHEVLDKRVNERIGPCINEQPGRADYMFLLQAVVEFSNGTLNPEYCDFHVALALIKSQPALTTMLHAAWNSGTYRDIRNLEILQIPRLRTMEDTLHRAFIAPYHGNAVDAFHEYLEINNKSSLTGLMMALPSTMANIAPSFRALELASHV
ncbi:hypothetical protein EDC04DRAFT_1445235 [Pisolithus marmoratus]|nr:hypothetical protein EDC04DRAFT_1445235 [Pisolithus marmoratus]